MLSSREQGRRKQAPVLVLIVVLTAVARIIGVNQQGLWMDEGLTLVISKWPVATAIAEPTDPSPFLYYALHACFIPNDAPLIAIRSISILCGVLTVAGMYVLAARMFGRNWGLFASALLALNAFHVDYSQEARAYSLLVLFLEFNLLGAYAFASVRAGQDQAGRAPSEAWLWLWALTSVGAFYTHIISVFWIALTGLYVLVFIVTNKELLRLRAIAPLAAAALAALPGLLRMSDQMQTGHTFGWLGQASPLTVSLALGDLWLPLGLWNNELTRSMGLPLKPMVLVSAALIASFGLALALRGRVASPRSRQDLAIAGAIAVSFVYVLVIWLIGYVSTPLFLTRTALPSVIGATLLITALSTRFRVSDHVAVRVSVLAVYALSLMLFGTMREREDLRPAAQYLATAMSTGDALIICPNYLYPALRYHIGADTKPHSATGPVMTAWPDRFKLIESGLGADTQWDEAYFQHVLKPEFEQRKAGQTVVPVVTGSELLDDTQTVWILESGCTTSHADLLDSFKTGYAREETMWRSSYDNPYLRGAQITKLSR